jgi:hypothetical protein
MVWAGLTRLMRNPQVAMAAAFALGSVFGAFIFVLALLGAEIMWHVQWFHFHQP